LKYRSRTDIIAQILEVALEGVTKTRIMYGAYLSYQQLEEYVGVLVQNGLLEHIPEERTFVTTLKGREFLKSYEHLNGLSGKMTAEPVKRQ
jgi:predicted transcriptional regulator